jgi:HEAT repeat protein
LDWLSEKPSLGGSLSEAVLLAISDLDRPQREVAIEAAAASADPEGLVGLISTEDVIRRNAALEALTKQGRRSVPALVRALSDPDPDVVMFAASTLGKTRDATAIPHLTRILRHADINVIQAAVESLGALRAASTLKALEELLQGDPWLRFSVVHTIGEIGHPSSVPTLLRLLADKQLHENAVGALGKIGGPEAVGELVRLLEGSSSFAEFKVYLNALGAALAQVSDPAALQKIPAWAAFARNGERVAADLVQALREPVADDGHPLDQLATKEAAIDLVRCLRLKSCYSEMVAAAGTELLRDALLFAAADIGIELEPHLTRALAHENRRVRLFACQAMAASMLERSAGAVTRLLADPDEEIRAAAVRVLARLHCTDALGDIVGRLGDGSVGVRISAIESLTRMDASTVTTAMLRNPAVLAQQRALVLSIMRDNPHPSQRGFLEACLSERDDGVRQAALQALVAAQPPDLGNTIEALLADSSVRVRREAIAALSERRSERSRQVLLSSLERDPETRSETIRALARVGDDRLIPKLIAIFESIPTAEQTLAVDTLGALGAPSAEPFLARKLAHPDATVRRHAVSALARIGSTPALRRLAVALRDSDPRVRLALSRALASCPHPIARNALERLSLDPVATVAAAARGEQSTQ